MNKKIVSMRITNGDRSSVQSIASRLYVRESEIYRFAVKQLLNRLDLLLDESCSGKDLIPLFLEFREELIQTLGFKKDQLYNIINGHETSPEKYVSMADIELLLSPQHLTRQYLLRIQQPPEINIGTDHWLKRYFTEKYFPEQE